MHVLVCTHMYLHTYIHTYITWMCTCIRTYIPTYGGSETDTVHLPLPRCGSFSLPLSPSNLSHLSLCLLRGQEEEARTVWGPVRGLACRLQPPCLQDIYMYYCRLATGTDDVIILKYTEAWLLPVTVHFLRLTILRRLEEPDELQKSDLLPPSSLTVFRQGLNKLLVLPTCCSSVGNLIGGNVHTYIHMYACMHIYVHVMKSM